MDLLPFVLTTSEDFTSYSNLNNITRQFEVISANLTSTEYPYKNLFDGFSSILLYFASTCCVIFMLLGIPGNLLTIIALSRCKKVRNATAVFIINLSCSDLLFCCFNLPLAATTFYYREWIHGDLMCQLFPVLRYGLLAVSLFTILAITINRYIMIGHPCIYPRIYRRRWLILMVSLTWLCAFGTLIQTWRGQWGRFGMDTSIGSCSILPVAGKSPKQFLFVMAFILPCFAIVLCYARIFYIVRKTAMKIHDPSRVVNGSIRMVLTSNNNNLNKKSSNELMKESNPIIEGKEPAHEYIRNIFSENTDDHRCKNLIKLKTDELKFIDSSCESDLPPTLSQLQYKNFQVESTPLSPPEPTMPIIEATIISLEKRNDQQLSLIYSNSIDTLQNVHKDATFIDKNTHDGEIDSAVEDSSASLEQNVHHLVSIPEPSSSSGIELPYDHELLKKNLNKKAKKKVGNTKVKQKKIKDESSPKNERRKKSLANTSALAINDATRMSTKDRKLLQMILVIFLSFLTCYLPITLTKIMGSLANINFVFISSYLLIYLTTCINPIIYVVMSSEYRQAYKQIFICNGSKLHLKKTNGNQMRGN